MSALALRPDRCPDCDGPLYLRSVWQPALFRHGGYGGYGAQRKTTSKHCAACGWHLVTEVTETSPRPMACGAPHVPSA